jgi:TRAP transporter TAXI family solute receptor
MISSPRRSNTLSAHPVLWLYALVGTLIILALAATVIWLGPLPPRVVVMSTGAPGSDYEQLGARYRDILKRSGVELRLTASAGGEENLRRLNDRKSGVTVAFAQGGLTSEAKSPDLRSLGTIFFEPCWLFSRVLPGPHLEGLRGKRVSIGPEGSGTHALATLLLSLNGVDPSLAEFRSLDAAHAGAALLHDELDAVAIVASWDSPAVRQLLAHSDVNVLGFPRADAYVALFPYLTKLVLPAGVGNLATNRPPADVNLIAPKASLIVRHELHPAIQYLLLEAAAEIHSTPGIFQQAGQFPAAQRGDVPLSKTVTQFYKSGTPFLQRYLPFWLAVLASRFLVLLIPLIGIALPLLHFAPALYSGAMLRRISRLYGELKLIEAELPGAGGVAAGDALGRLQRLDERAHRLHLPVAFAPFSYALRSHIALVQTRLHEQQSRPTTEPAEQSRVKAVERS